MFYTQPHAVETQTPPSAVEHFVQHARITNNSIRSHVYYRVSLMDVIVDQITFTTKTLRDAFSHKTVNKLMRAHLPVRTPLRILLSFVNEMSNSLAVKEPETADHNSRDDFDRGNGNFTAAFLYSGIDESPNSSIITSPFSVLFLLAQLALYAKGTSYEQLANLLNIKSRNEIRSIVPDYLDDINSQQNVTLQLAEKVYGNVQFPFKKSFKRDTRLVFHAEAENLDFSDPIQAANSINSWIASETNNLVKDLISPSVLSQNTRLVLTDAIYFKGDWQTPFNAKMTKLKDFYINESITVSVNMMNQINTFNYGNLDSINAKVLQLFYKSSNVSFVAILPNKGQDVLTIAQKFKSSCFDFKEDVINKLKSRKVNVSLPLIDTETTTDLEEILKKTSVKYVQKVALLLTQQSQPNNQNGVTEIFDPDTSDLTGILKQAQKLYVSSAVQKAKIIVNESGSEAAAGNAFIIGLTSVQHEAQPEEFNANTPFVYYILFKYTPIFAGFYSGPQ
ncbi:antichymotrypsin-2-like [Zerene cesonia]|uniref:antichymotrypsin-2-like n=1 Tax=Zerene cesonia TaxID=33412 RepID=UPI0018E52D33|nr:antichymotrypsin-2-like [Zerene cesonia]